MSGMKTEAADADNNEPNNQPTIKAIKPTNQQSAITIALP